VSDRRADLRIPVELPLIQYVDNRPIASVTSDLSLSGLHACHAIEPMSRSSKLVQLELELPGLDEPLWVKGEVVYDAISPVHHSSGIRFIAMAHRHERALAEWLEQQATGEA
jgi:hypothetical protein